MRQPPPNSPIGFMFTFAMTMWNFSYCQHSHGLTLLVNHLIFPIAILLMLYWVADRHLKFGIGLTVFLAFTTFNGFMIPARPVASSLLTAWSFIMFLGEIGYWMQYDQIKEDTSKWWY